MSSSMQARNAILSATLPDVEPNVSLAMLVAQMEEHSGRKLTRDRAPLLNVTLPRTLRRPRELPDIEDQLYTFDDYSRESKRQKIMAPVPTRPTLHRRDACASVLSFSESRVTL